MPNQRLAMTLLKMSIQTSTPAPSLAVCAHQSSSEPQNFALFFFPDTNELDVQIGAGSDRLPVLT